MRGTSRSACITALAFCACTFGADGNGSGGPGLGDSADGAGDDLGSDDAAMSEDGFDDGSDGGGVGGDDQSVDTGDGGDDAAEVGDPTNDSSTDGHAHLVLNSDDPIAFSLTGVGESGKFIAELTNDGDMMATNLSPGGLSDPSFVFIGGFPGEDGDCETSLAPGETCLIDLTFAPLAWGNKAADLTVTYDGGTATNAHVAVDGICGGASNDLVINGSFEEDISTGWEMSPSSWTTSTSSPFTGQQAAYAGSSSSINFNLTQSVDVSQWSSTIDTGMLQVVFSGHHRTDSSLHSNFLRVRFRGGSGDDLGTSESSPNFTSQWADGGKISLLPIGTRSVEITAVCSKLTSSACHGYFDGVSLITRFPAQ